MHQVTEGWPQRPGTASTRELLTVDRGGDADLARMPAEAVAACRRAWAAVAGSEEAVVHGDPGPGNIRITAGGVGLLDWDEAPVDVTELDLAELPGADLPPPRLAVVRAAATAWEAANGWTVKPSYARRQLALLYAGGHSSGWAAPRQTGAGRRRLSRLSGAVSHADARPCRWSRGAGGRAQTEEGVVAPGRVRG